MSGACLVLAVALVAGAAGAGDGVEVLPAVSVGGPEVAPSVLSKVTELTGDALRRAGAPAPAAPSDPGEALVEAAHDLYIHAEFKRALASAEAAVAHYRDHPALVGDGARVIDAYVYAALAELELKHKDRVRQFLTAALVQRPDLKLSEMEFSPLAVVAVEQARRAELTGRPKASLTLTSTPPFAHAWVDGARIGETPVTARDLFIGRHVVRIESDGRTTQSTWVDLKQAGQVASVSLDLRENPVETGRLAVTKAARTGAGAELEKRARELARAAGVESVVVLGVARLDQAYAVSVARVRADKGALRGFGAISSDLVDAPQTLNQLAGGLLENRDAAPVAVGRPVPASALDFQRHFLGLKPGEPSVAAALIGPPVPEVEPPTPVWKRPVLWVGVGGAVVAAAGVYALTRPGPRPATLTIDIVLPQ